MLKDEVVNLVASPLPRQSPAAGLTTSSLLFMNYPKIDPFKTPFFKSNDIQKVQNLQKWYKNENVIFILSYVNDDWIAIEPFSLCIRNLECICMYISIFWRFQKCPLRNKSYFKHFACMFCVIILLYNFYIIKNCYSKMYFYDNYNKIDVNSLIFTFFSLHFIYSSYLLFSNFLL